MSLVPKSVTAPVHGHHENYGIPASRGVCGRFAGRWLANTCSMRLAIKPTAAGRIIHLSNSAWFGAAMSVVVNEDAGAYAGLALGPQVVLASASNAAGRVTARSVVSRQPIGCGSPACGQAFACSSGRLARLRVYGRDGVSQTTLPDNCTP
jgi:hypothetical protein